MLSCDESVPLLARAVDALLDQEELDRLREHLWQCGSCRKEVEAQLSVKWVLAERPEEALPAGFGERLARRLNREARHPQRGCRGLERPPVSGRRSVDVNGGTLRWLELLNWRKWSIRLLPVALALIAWAAIAGHTDRGVASIDLATAVEAWTLPGEAATTLLVDPEVSDDSLLFVLLSHDPERPAQENPP